jgi:hypothetical protein
MSDYKTTRLKKNAEIMNAMANIRKDLYEWKPPTNVFKTNNSNGMTSNLTTQRLQSFDSSNSASTFKRTGSLSSINSGRSVNSGKFKNPSSISNRLRPLSTNKSKKSLTDDFNDKDMLDLDDNLDDVNATQDNEFLKTFKSNKNSSNNERLYLNSARATIQSSRRTYEEIENELVIKFDFVSAKFLMFNFY